MGFWYRQERWAVSHKRINKKSINTYLLYMLSPAFSRGPRISAKAWLWGIKVNLYFLFRALQLAFAARAREGRGTFLSPRTLLAVSFAWIPPPPLDPPPPAPRSNTCLVSYTTTHSPDNESEETFIHHLRSGKRTGAEMRPASVSGIVTGDAPVSYWPIRPMFFRLWFAPIDRSPLGHLMKFTQRSFPLY